MLSLMAIQPGRKHGIDVGELFKKVLGYRRLKQEAVAREIGYEPSRLSRALNGEPNAPLDLWRVLDAEQEAVELFLTECLSATACGDSDAAA